MGLSNHLGGLVVNRNQSPRQSLVYWWARIAPCLRLDSHREQRKRRWQDGARPKLLSSLNANLVPVTLSRHPTSCGGRIPSSQNGLIGSGGFPGPFLFHDSVSPCVGDHTLFWMNNVLCFSMGAREACVCFSYLKSNRTR